MASNSPVWDIKTVNRSRLNWLLAEEGTRAMRQFFLTHASDTVLKPEEFPNFIETSKIRLDELKRKNKLNNKQYNMLFPSEEANINKLDMTLLYILISNFCVPDVKELADKGIEAMRKFLESQPDPFSKFIETNKIRLDEMKREKKLSNEQYDMVFPSKEVDINKLNEDLLKMLISIANSNKLKNITDLKNFRNDQSHIYNYAISEDDFRNERGRLSDILKELGVDTKAIQLYFTQSISVVKQKQIEETIRNEFKEDLEDVKKDIKSTKHDLQNLTNKLEKRGYLDDISKTDENDGPSLSKKRQPSKEYDFYVVSDDLEWESRILSKIEKMGHRGYDRRKFRLGGLKSKGRLDGVKNCKVVIIGFVSPSKKKTDTSYYVAALAEEYWKVGKHLICVPLSPDAIIPEDFSAFSAWPSGMGEDELCTSISDTVNSVKFESGKV